MPAAGRWPLATLAAYQARDVEIDGCSYREGLNAVGISGGVAGNVIPDEATLLVNFRYAPDRDEDAAEAHVNADHFKQAQADLPQYVQETPKIRNVVMEGDHWDRLGEFEID